MLMTTQTLEARPEGTGEQRGPSVENLADALSDYRAALDELGAYRSKSARAELSVAEVLENGALSEEESAQKISQAQNLKGVYAGRATNLERKAAVLLEQLKESLAAAMRAQSNEVGLLIDRRREQIIERVYEALGRPSQIARGEVMHLTRFCPAIQKLECLQPGNFYEVPKLPSDSVLATAESVLRNQATLEEDL